MALAARANGFGGAINYHRLECVTPGLAERSGRGEGGSALKGGPLKAQEGGETDRERAQERGTSGAGGCQSVTCRGHGLCYDVIGGDTVG